jgi:hypothetical protein
MMEKKSGNENKERCPAGNEVGQYLLAKGIDRPPTGNAVTMTDDDQNDGHGTKILK